MERYQPYKPRFIRKPRLRRDEQDEPGLLVLLFLYVLPTLSGFLPSQHHDGAQEGFRRKTRREAVQVGIGWRAVKQGAGTYREKHMGAMETGGVQQQGCVRPPETGRRDRRLARSV